MTSILDHQPPQILPFPSFSYQNQGQLGSRSIVFFLNYLLISCIQNTVTHQRIDHLLNAASELKSRVPPRVFTKSSIADLGPEVCKVPGRKA